MSATGASRGRSRVERVPLAPGSELRISPVVTGLWQVADQERGGADLDPESAADAMARYADAGLTTFDMADHYGTAEVVAGRLARRRDDVQLLTKWAPAPGPISAEIVANAVDRACRRLGTERVDLLQFHPWSYADPSWLEALFLLSEQRERGRVRHLGLTNCDAAHLDMAVRSGLPIASNQVCCSLLDRRAQGAMADVCRVHGVGLLAYGALAGGFLSDRWLGAPEPKLDESLTWSQMKYLRFIEQAGGWDAFQGLLRTVAGVARRLGEPATVANVALKHALERPAVAGVVVGARLGEREHVEDNLNALRLGLDDRSRRELDDACARLDPIPGDCGDEYRRPPFLTAAGDLSHHVEEFPPPYPVRERNGVRRVSTGTPWEELAGYSRAVQVGDRVLVAGTTASLGARRIGGDDPAAQTHFALDKIDGALQSLGGGLSDVVRTRVYVAAGVDWAPVARAHGQRFAEIRPVNTLIRAEPVAPGFLVEIEAEARVR